WYRSGWILTTLKGDFIMSKLNDKLAILTGGAGGIGRGVGTSFVKEGAKVVIVDLNEEAAEEVVKNLQAYESDAMFLQADLTEHSKMKDVVKAVVDKYGKVEILVNNAHASKMASIEETTQEDFDFSFNTGFYPTFYLMQAAIPPF